MLRVQNSRTPLLGSVRANKVREETERTRMREDGELRRHPCTGVYAAVNILCPSGPSHQSGSCCIGVWWNRTLLYFYRVDAVDVEMCVLTTCLIRYSVWPF
jgi:hypothetical protein